MLAVQGLQVEHVLLEDVDVWLQERLSKGLENREEGSDPHLDLHVETLYSLSYMLQPIVESKDCTVHLHKDTKITKTTVYV